MGNVKLTSGQTRRIEELRSQGIGYRMIAQELGLSRDTVRNYCRSRGMTGIAEEKMYRADFKGKCLQCGTEIQETTGSNRRFCSDSCRRKWMSQNNHAPRPSATREEVKCQNCGKPFSAYKSKSRRYCSHDCYIRDRFWRLEDGREPYVSPSKS